MPFDLSLNPSFDGVDLFYPDREDMSNRCWEIMDSLPAVVMNKLPTQGTRFEERRATDVGYDGP